MLRILDSKQLEGYVFQKESADAPAVNCLLDMWIVSAR